MMHKEELKDKCALCGRLILSGSSSGDSNTVGNPKLIIKEKIQNNHYKFDTQDCATMFKRLLGVYGNEFQHFLGDKQYISDPFWDRVVPKENEIREIRDQEEAGKGENDTTQSDNITKKSEVVSLIRNSFEVQELINHLVESAKEDIVLAIPNTAAEIFFYPQGKESSSFSCSVFFQLLKDVAAANKSLNVKILTNTVVQKHVKEQDDKDILSDLKQRETPNIHIKHIEQDYSSLNENMVILVVDRNASLAVELEELRKDNNVVTVAEEVVDKTTPAVLNRSHWMIKLATYSSNKSTVLSYISIFESLWKEIELNEKITSLLGEIKKREHIERDFINMAAHELRAPIQPVLGLAQILQTKKNVDTKEQEELLSVIIRNARRLNILTENLLDLAKIESDTLKLQRETFSLAELLFDAIADMKSQLSSNQVIVNVEYNDGSTKVNQENIPTFLVEADKTRIMQVISNLLTNAIKFTRGGKVVISLDNKKRTDGRNKKGEGKQGGEAEREVIVSFRDSGTGIDPEIIDKIFEKFITKSDKGTGLGLFISKKIIEAHGGSIWAKNNTNAEGATIAFSLPVSSE